MPFSDPKGYDIGHFRKIYDQILAPAIVMAGYTPHRIDENAESTMIHGKLLDQLVNAPMVLCDLSSKNPNVLYELGIRHAFDKPVVLVQEKGQERIFDIAGLTTAEYRKERLYDEVMEDQRAIAEAIRQTATAEKYSIMSLVKLTPATVSRNMEISGEDRMEILLSDMAHRLKSIEQRVMKPEDPVSWGIEANKQEEAERGLVAAVTAAKTLIIKWKMKASSVPKAEWLLMVNRLEGAVLECQHLGSQNTELIEMAKRTLFDLHSVKFDRK